MFDWQAVDTLLLDMDGTLLDLHFDSYFWLEFLPERYAQVHGRSHAEVRHWLQERIAREQGTLNWYCLDYWSRELQLPIAQMKREIADRIAFRPQVEDFLAAVREANIRSVIVTNAHRDSLSLKMERTRIHELVDLVVCSHDFGVPKEEQGFWQALQEVEAFNPQRTLLVDDSLSVLRSAQRYGIAYLLAITQPDSHEPPRQISEFPAINDFNRMKP